MRRTFTKLLLVVLCIFLFGARGCDDTLNDIWDCLAGLSNCGLGAATHNPWIQDVVPPEIPCGGGKSTGVVTVDISTSPTINPPVQYCFVKIQGSQSWVSAPVAFAAGTRQLSFSGFSLGDENYEVIACVTPDLAIAQGGDPSLAWQLKKTQIQFANAQAWKCPLIEYDCMTGYDIRGPLDTTNNDNLFKYANKRFKEGYTNPVFLEDELSLGPQSFSTIWELQDFILAHWEQKFWLGQTEADFYLLGIGNCINRAHFYGPLPGDSMGSGTPGLAQSANGQQLGQRGASGVVFKAFLDSILNVGSRQDGYNRISVHELGHSLAGLTDVGEDPELHTGVDANCVMNYFAYYANGTIPRGRDKFCGKCKTNIMNTIWQQESAL